MLARLFGVGEGTDHGAVVDALGAQIDAADQRLMAAELLREFGLQAVERGLARRLRCGARRPARHSRRCGRCGGAALRAARRDPRRRATASAVRMRCARRAPAPALTPAHSGSARAAHCATPPRAGARAARRVLRAPLGMARRRCGRAAPAAAVMAARRRLRLHRCGARRRRQARRGAAAGAGIGGALGAALGHGGAVGTDGDGVDLLRLAADHAAAERAAGSSRTACRSGRAAAPRRPICR